jgi:hypothetical protein
MRLGEGVGSKLREGGEGIGPIVVVLARLVPRLDDASGAATNCVAEVDAKDLEMLAKVEGRFRVEVLEVDLSNSGIQCVGPDFLRSIPPPPRNPEGTRGSAPVVNPSPANDLLRFSTGLDACVPVSLPILQLMDTVLSPCSVLGLEVRGRLTGGATILVAVDRGGSSNSGLDSMMMMSSSEPSSSMIRALAMVVGASRRGCETVYQLWMDAPWVDWCSRELAGGVGVSRSTTWSYAVPSGVD